jgi:hypothetical protein
MGMWLRCLPANDYVPDRYDIFWSVGNRHPSSIDLDFTYYNPTSNIDTCNREFAKQRMAIVLAYLSHVSSIIKLVLVVD